MLSKLLQARCLMSLRFRTLFSLFAAGGVLHVAINSQFAYLMLILQRSTSKDRASERAAALMVCPRSIEIGNAAESNINVSAGLVLFCEL